MSFLKKCKTLKFQLYAPAIMLILWAILLTVTDIDITPGWLAMISVSIVLQVRALLKKYTMYK